MIGAGIGGWFLYHQISNKLASNNVIPVNYYVGMREAQARAKITADGFSPRRESPLEPEDAGGLRLQAGARAGDAQAQGRPGDDLGLVGRAEGRGAVARRPAVDGRRRGA